MRIARIQSRVVLNLPQQGCRLFRPIVQHRLTVAFHPNATSQVQDSIVNDVLLAGRMNPYRYE